MELGKQIRMYRQEAQLSQEELADRVYVSRQTISNWENDKSYPDVNSLVLLSEVFHISLDNLIKGDIDVQGPVVVDTSAVVMGNIKSRSVQINNGAVIEGFCSQCYSDVDVKSLFENKEGKQ